MNAAQDAYIIGAEILNATLLVSQCVSLHERVRQRERCNIPSFRSLVKVPAQRRAAGIQLKFPMQDDEDEPTSSSG